jgi:ethanolamine utilization protein EutN
MYRKGDMMILAKVCGKVISTKKIKNLMGYPLLLLQAHDGNTFVAVDTIGAGEGDWVLVSQGQPVRFGIDKDAPVDALIVGIADNDPYSQVKSRNT